MFWFGKENTAPDFCLTKVASPDSIVKIHERLSQPETVNKNPRFERRPFATSPRRAFARKEDFFHLIVLGIERPISFVCMLPLVCTILLSLSYILE